MKPWYMQDWAIALTNWLLPVGYALICAGLLASNCK